MMRCRGLLVVLAVAVYSLALGGSPALAADRPTVGFGAATYSGAEGDSITIELRLSEAQSSPLSFQVSPKHGSKADYWSDYSLGECPELDPNDPEITDEERQEAANCDFGVGVLYGEIAAGDTVFSYDIRTEDDHRVEGNETFTLSLWIGSRSVDLGDNSETVITIIDNDTAGVEVGAEEVSVTEDTSGTYTVKLTSQPGGRVRVYAESAMACKVGVNNGYVDFGPEDWDEPQTFRVRSKFDADAADEEIVITHRVEPTIRTFPDEPEREPIGAVHYDGVSAGSVTVKVTDKHSAAVMVETATTLEPTVGTTANYRVYLDADPSPIYGTNPADCYDYNTSNTVIISATSSDPAVATVDPASVTFTADDYDPKTFTVTALTSGTVSITHTISGTDPDYNPEDEDETILVQQVAVEVPSLSQQGGNPSSSPQQTNPDGAMAVPVPGPVLGLGLLATAGSLTVSWEAPDSGDPPTRYIAHLMPVGGGKGKTKTPKPKKTEVTFTNLEAGTAYKLFVRAKNKAGKGPRTYTVVTLPHAPS